MASGRERLEPLLRSGLCVIVDPEHVGGRDPVEVARSALDGGAGMIQLRAKTGSDHERYQLALALAQLCRQRGALFVVNDRVDLALAAEADGVHVGQTDLPVAAVRRLAPEVLVGASTNNPAEAYRSAVATADVLGVGAMFPTASKVDTRPAGPDVVRAIREILRTVPGPERGRTVPLLAIGGIRADNLAPVIAAGADAVAVIGAVAAAPNVADAAARIVEAVRAARSAV